MAEIHKYRITYSYGNGPKKTVHTYATTRKAAMGQFKRTDANIHEAVRLKR